MAGFTRKDDSELAIQRKVSKAYKTLGIGPLLGEVTSVEDVQKHYTFLVKALHPDSSEKVEGLVADVTLEQIRQAKDYLVKHLERSDNG